MSSESPSLIVSTPFTLQSSDPQSRPLVTVEISTVYQLSCLNYNVLINRVVSEELHHLSLVSCGHFYANLEGLCNVGGVIL